MKLPFYILRRFFQSFIAVSLFVLTLVTLLDIVNQMTQFSARGVSNQSILTFCFLRLPDNFLLFLPLVVLLAAMFCFLGLARTSEIVIMRAAGVAATRFVLVPVVAVGVMGILIITFLNPIFVNARTTAQNYENQFFDRPEGLVSFSKTNGVWLRSQTRDDTRVFRLSKVNWENEVANGVTIYTYFADGTISEIQSERAYIKDHQWILLNATEVKYGDEVNKMRSDRMEIPANDEFEGFFSDYFSPRNINNADLPDYIEDLQRDGYDAKEAKGYFYQQLALPLNLMSLCLIGAIFALAPERMGGVTQRIFLAVGVGFVVYAAMRISESLGVAGSIPVGISVVAIPIPAFFIALSILLRQEDG